MTALPKPGKVTIGEVLDCLNHYRVRATYQAVGEVIGCHWRQVGSQHLKKASRLTSWVVNKATRQPSDPEYADEPLLVHPDLERIKHVIEERKELLALIAAYRVRHLTCR